MTSSPPLASLASNRAVLNTERRRSRLVSPSSRLALPAPEFADEAADAGGDVRFDSRRDVLRLRGHRGVRRTPSPRWRARWNTSSRSTVAACRRSSRPSPPAAMRSFFQGTGPVGSPSSPRATGRRGEQPTLVGPRLARDGAFLVLLGAVGLEQLYDELDGRPTTGALPARDFVSPVSARSATRRRAVPASCPGRMPMAPSPPRPPSPTHR